MTIEAVGVVSQHGFLPRATVTYIVWFTIVTRRRVCKNFKIKEIFYAILENSSTVEKKETFQWQHLSFGINTLPQ